MRIIARKNIVAFAGKHPLAGPSLRYWLRLAEAADWKSTGDVVRSLNSAKAIDNERVRFEVSRNTFRMICAFHFPSGSCYVKFLGTHAEYDAVDARTVDMF